LSPLCEDSSDSGTEEEPLTPSDGAREAVSSTVACGPAGMSALRWAKLARSFWMIWWWGTPSRSISLSWSRISFGSRATLPQRARNANGLLDLWIGGLMGRTSPDGGLLDCWICRLVRMSEVEAVLWFFVLICFVCVVFLLVIGEIGFSNGRKEHKPRTHEPSRGHCVDAWLVDGLSPPTLSLGERENTVSSRLLRSDGVTSRSALAFRAAARQDRSTDLSCSRTLETTKLLYYCN